VGFTRDVLSIANEKKGVKVKAEGVEKEVIN